MNLRLGLFGLHSSLKMREHDDEQEEAEAGSLVPLVACAVAGR